MNNFQYFSTQLPPEKIQQALSLAQQFNNRNFVPLNINANKLKALNDCIDSGEKICRAMKELDTDYLKTLGFGLALLRGMQCQQEDQNKQGGPWQ